MKRPIEVRDVPLIMDKKPNKKKKRSKLSRPTILVQPRELGPIDNPNKNDVLQGRGRNNSGNLKYRKLASSWRDAYMDKKTKKLEKAHIAAQIVYKIRSMNPPGRFLEEEDGAWWDIGDEKAIKKAAQSMRDSHLDQDDKKPEPSDPPAGEEAIKKVAQAMRDSPLYQDGSPTKKPVLKTSGPPVHARPLVQQEREERTERINEIEPADAFVNVIPARIGGSQVQRQARKHANGENNHFTKTFSILESPEVTSSANFQSSSSPDTISLSKNTDCRSLEKSPIKYVDYLICYYD